jgi:predicted nucleotidyltransferase
MMIERRTQSVDVIALTEYLAAQPDVIAAYLFGSRATGRACAESRVRQVGPRCRLWGF